MFSLHHLHLGMIGRTQGHATFGKYTQERRGSFCVGSEFGPKCAILQMTIFPSFLLPR